MKGSRRQPLANEGRPTVSLAFASPRATISITVAIVTLSQLMAKSVTCRHQCCTGSQRQAPRKSPFGHDGDHLIRCLVRRVRSEASIAVSELTIRWRSLVFLSSLKWKAISGAAIVAVLPSVSAPKRYDGLLGARGPIKHLATPAPKSAYLSGLVVAG